MFFQRATMSIQMSLPFFAIGKCSYSSGTHSKALALHFFVCCFDGTGK